MSTPTTRRFGLSLLLLALLAVAFLAIRSLRRPNDTATPAPTAAETGDSQRPASSAVATSRSVGNAPTTQGVSLRAELDRARGIADPQQRSREFGRLIQLWLQQDPDAALAYVCGLPRGSPEFTSGLLMALDVVARMDVNRALRLAAELVTTREQMFFYNALFARLAEHDPTVAARELAAVPAGEARTHAVRALAETWSRHDAAAALAWAQTLKGEDRPIAIESVVAELVPSDPLRAIETAQQSLTGPALDRILAAALHQLTTTDPRSAASIVPLLPAGDTKTFAAADVAAALAASNPRDALAWVQSLSGPGPARSVATARVLEIWANTDRSNAEQYVTGLPAGDAQREAAVTLARSTGGTDPRQAIGWAESLPGDTRAAAFSAIANAWAQHDGAAASRWVAEQPADRIADAAGTLNATLSYWVLQDAAGAQAFVSSLPSGAQSAAAAFIAPLTAQTNPSATLAWAQSLPDPAAREAAVAAAYGRWVGNAPAAAQTWLSTADIAPELKSRLQSRR
ncbi:MAG TPA: hypothetical protein VHE61_18575 [Opitutaceae bacterium]|nr:hypothetical protein [Opitutaceae bacterium]